MLFHSHPAFYHYQDQFLDNSSELSRFFEDDIAHLLSRPWGTIATRFFHQYSNKPGNTPLEECHMRGVSTLVGLNENGISGVLVESGIG